MKISPSKELGEKKNQMLTSLIIKKSNFKIASFIINDTFCQVRVEMQKLTFTKFNEKHLLCIAKRPADLEKAAVADL